jgi:hypothetical protein
MANPLKVSVTLLNEAVTNYTVHRSSRRGDGPAPCLHSGCPEGSVCCWLK